MFIFAPLPPAQAQAPRYQLERAGDGFVRLDRVTGETSFCRIEGSVGLVCRVAAEERAAHEHQIKTLSQQTTGSKASIEQRKAEAEGEISLIAYILERMIHAARDVADTADRKDIPPKSP